METTIFLIRHGETHWNTQKRVQGRTNILLNEIGLFQAHLKSSIWNNLTFNHTYTSPLIRAKETGLILNKLTNQNTTLIDHEGLIERCFGELEGIQFDINSFSNDDTWFRENYPNFESNQEIENRVEKFIWEVVNKHPNSIIGCYTHSHVIKAALAIAKYKTTYETKIENCGIVKIVVNKSGINVISENFQVNN